jgi:Flp pilus assembly pilin Flp
MTTNFFKRARNDTKGASLLEYSVLIGILLVISMVAISGVGNWQIRSGSH